MLATGYERRDGLPQEKFGDCVGEIVTFFYLRLQSDCRREDNEYSYVATNGICPSSSSKPLCEGMNAVAPESLQLCPTESFELPDQPVTHTLISQKLHIFHLTKAST